VQATSRRLPAARLQSGGCACGYFACPTNAAASRMRFPTTNSAAARRRARSEELRRVGRLCCIADSVQMERTLARPSRSRGCDSGWDPR
jgi:hypothetical protein